MHQISLVRTPMSAASSAGTSAMGSWTQQDPVGGSLGDLNSANRYVYAGDDPVNAVDPSGKDCLFTLLSAISLLYWIGWLWWTVLGAIVLVAEANPPLGVLLLFLYVVYTVPFLGAIAINAYNNVAAACGWPPFVQRGG